MKRLLAISALILLAGTSWAVDPIDLRGTKNISVIRVNPTKFIIGTTNIVALGYWENTNGVIQLKTDWQLWADALWTTNGSGEIVLK